MIDAAQTDGGIVTHQAAQVTSTCLLDQLLTNGLLKAPDEPTDERARRRHEAGMWLRALYHEKAMLAPRTSAHYGQGIGGDEISDAVAWNRKVFADTIRALPISSRMLTAVCCHDEPRGMMSKLRVALDSLADHRGM